jgi:predicted ATPase/class 3 adenylate cyclase/DNA-binding SARP family transcriptional activator
LAVIAPDQAPLQIQFFGPFAVRVHGHPLASLRSRKGEWLLALLVLRAGHKIERDWLAGTLWPDSLELQALANLRTSLKDLRQALGAEAWRVSAPTTRSLSLDLVGADVDVIAFECRVRRGDPASLEEAVGLYRGPLLEGCGEEWAFEERQVREQAYLTALETLAARALAAGDPTAAEEYLRRALARDPLREAAQRALMQTLAAGGHATAARQVYQEWRRRLHRELNAEPDAETTALFQQLREAARRKALRGAQCSVLGEGGGSSPGHTARPTLAEHLRPSFAVCPSPRPSHCPEGTVTFLLTDIESSTKHWLQHPDAMHGALPRHDALAAALIAQHHGILVKHRGEGDSLFAVFSRALDAVAASLDLQRALVAEPWPAETSLQVRIALHTGDAELRDEDYYGPAVNHCARLRAAGHGGQILLSQTTAALVRDHLPEGASLRELGAHRLKDLQRPEPIFQLAHPELPGEFPPLQSLEAFAHNLPVQLTRFIGRKQAIAEVQRLLPTTHLLTLTGAGGCGKTRLALQVAADRVEAYADGVWLVELAALADPSLVPQRVASVLGVREAGGAEGASWGPGPGGRSLAEALTGYLGSRSLLLVLDNCEHLLSACAELADRLLRACPTLRILATSREPLGVAGEQSYRVPSLSVPEPGLSSVERLREFEAVQLFTDRAVLCQPTFSVTSDNAASVVEVCQRLGGIPLAIELAAARVKLLPVEQIAARLDDRFRLLTGGSRTALPRQQTLRALVDWSYDLLSEEERALLRRLSVFSGGWTLDAAEGVCADPVVSRQLPVVSEGGPSSPLPTAYCLLPTDEILDLLGRLVNKSLVLAEEHQGESRHHLLETIRQYGAEKLQAGEERLGRDSGQRRGPGPGGEEAVWRGRHRDYFLRLAEEADPQLHGAAQGEWMLRLEREHDNLRAALVWSTERGDAEAGLRLGGALWRFWMMRGYLTEGRERLTALLSLPGAEARTVVRGKALHGAGVLAHRQGDYEGARALLEEKLAIGRDLGDPYGIAWSLNNLGNVARARDQGDDEAARALREEARALYAEGLAIFRELGDQEGIAWSLKNLGDVALVQGEHEGARALLEESLAIHRKLGNHRGIAWSVGALGNVAFVQGDYGAARALYQESLAIFRELGSPPDIAYSLYNMGNAATRQGEHQAARALYEESLAIGHELGSHIDIAHALGALGHLARETGDYARCAAHYRQSMALRQSRDDRWGIAQGLEDFAGLAGRQRQWERAVRLLGAAEGVAQTLGRSLPVALRDEYQRTMNGARPAMGEAAFAAAWADGRAMTLDQSVAFALEG